jgi:hypothetical protein
MCALDLILKSPVIAALVAGASGGLIVWLGLRRFKTERWWERKAAAYAAIIGSLHRLGDVEDEQIDAIEKSVELPIKRLEDIRQKSIAARAEIREYASLGGFIVTEQTAKILDDVTRVLEIPHRGDSQSPHKYHEIRWAAVTEALAAVKHEAKSDLRTGY